MKYLIYIFTGIFTFFIGISITPQPGFAQLYGDNFKSSGSDPLFMSDCPGCGEIGNIEIYHEKLRPEGGYYSIEAQCGAHKNVVQRELFLGEKGEIVGEK